MLQRGGTNYLDSTLPCASSDYQFFGAVPSVSDIKITNSTLNVPGVFKYSGFRDAVVDALSTENVRFLPSAGSPSILPQ
jgi:hypothetical protein